MVSLHGAAMYGRHLEIHAKNIVNSTANPVLAEPEVQT
jgi:hypothetical protein